MLQGIDSIFTQLLMSSDLRLAPVHRALSLGNAEHSLTWETAISLWQPQSAMELSGGDSIFRSEKEKQGANGT